MTSSAQQVEEFRDRWRRGEPGRFIARSLGCHPGKVRAVLAAHGGVRLPERPRHERQLTSAEREKITRGIASVQSPREIAVRLGRSASTVFREIARNGGRYGSRAPAAESAAWQ